jgi:hypothetical protein
MEWSGIRSGSDGRATCPELPRAFTFRTRTRLGGDAKAPEGRENRRTSLHVGTATLDWCTFYGRKFKLTVPCCSFFCIGLRCSIMAKWLYLKVWVLIGDSPLTDSAQSRMRGFGATPWRVDLPPLAHRRWSPNSRAIFLRFLFVEQFSKRDWILLVLSFSALLIFFILSDSFMRRYFSALQSTIALEKVVFLGDLFDGATAIMLAKAHRYDYKWK